MCIAHPELATSYDYMQQTYTVRPLTNADATQMGLGLAAIIPFVGQGVRKGSAAMSVEAQLMRHVDSAVARFQAVGFTNAQLARVQLNPRLAPMFTGERIDTFFKHKRLARIHFCDSRDFKSHLGSNLVLTYSTPRPMCGTM
jgi:hypothetical protein